MTLFVILVAGGVLLAAQPQLHEPEIREKLSGFWTGAAFLPLFPGLLVLACYFWQEYVGKRRNRRIRAYIPR